MSHRVAQHRHAVAGDRPPDGAVSYTFAQAIHTPTEMKVPTLIEDDAYRY